jgi:PilZ domain
MNIRSQILGASTASEQPLLKTKAPKGVRADELHSIPVEREETRSADTRQEDRHRLSGEKIRLTHAGKSYDVELVNLSGGGAMVSGDLEPMLWDKVELQLGENGTVECAVLWLRDDRIGLEFAHETRLACSADEQAAVLREVIARSFPDLEFDDRSAETAGPREQRQGARHPLVWSGVLYHDNQTTMVRVRNISNSGAMVESSAPVRVGAQPVLELSDAASLGCDVAWAIGDQVGLRFHKPFDMNLLATSRPEVAQDIPGNWDHATLNELHDELKGFMNR